MRLEVTDQAGATTIYLVPTSVPCPHCHATLVTSLVAFGDLATGGAVDCSVCGTEIRREQIAKYFGRIDDVTP